MARCGLPRASAISARDSRIVACAERSASCHERKLSHKCSITRRNSDLKMVQGRINGGERDFGYAFAAILVDIQPPGAGLNFASAHQLARDFFAIGQGSLTIRRMNSGLVGSARGAIYQLECVKWHGAVLSVR